MSAENIILKEIMYFKYIKEIITKNYVYNKSNKLY